VDPEPHGSALIWLSWIWIRIGNADPDPGAWKYNKIVTINVPVVYMGRDVWIWMGGNPYRGPFEGVGPGIETFLGPEIKTSAA
jgi:hypothetical protein